MVLPLSLLKTAQNHPMLIELKNGETYNGMLVACDSWMNVHLRDAICTSKEGDRFVKIPEVYVRGSTIKYLRIPDEVVDLVKDEVKEVRRQQKENQRMKKQFSRVVVVVEGPHRAEADAAEEDSHGERIEEEVEEDSREGTDNLNIIVVLIDIGWISNWKNL
uniref:U6 snRNA-associated Sm-like protein LSm4 n=1 Tax=Globodera pallida TaxID=36090 RepID=A0A183CRB0_GLOPA